MSNDTTQDPKRTPDSAEGSGGLNRRGFLKISSAAAATAAVAGSTLAKSRGANAPGAKSLGKASPKGAAKDMKGGWFVV